MAKPGLLVDSGALIALANRRETANQAVNRVLGDFFGELVTTWPAVTEACHMIPDHLAPVLLAWLGGALTHPSCYPDEPVASPNLLPVGLADGGGTWRGDSAWQHARN